MAVRLKEGKKPRVAGDGINISDNNVISVLLRATNNLIHINENRELYVDLQLEDGIEPTDEFPVGITTGKILAEDGRQRSGIILNRKTTSGDYVRLILANNGTLYIDKGTGIWEEIGGGGGGGDSNVKEFVLPNLDNPTVGQQIVDWYLDGNYPIVVYNGSSYIVESRVNSTALRLYDIHTTVTHWLNQGKSTVQRNALYVYWDANGDFVDASIDVIAIAPYVIDTNQTYQHPYIPTDDGNPTSKYYVDLHDTYIDQVAPSNPYQGQLRYDITNNVLKSYDGTSWNTVGGGGGGGSYTPGYGINIDGNNEISNSLPFDPENQGRVGQVIKKTATGIKWDFEGGGGGTGETYLPGDNIVFDVQGTPDTQGPCPDGFHIPTKAEMDSFIGAAIMRGYNLDYETNFFLPKAGYYDPDQYQVNLIDQGTTGYYWTSSYDSNGKAFLFDIASDTTVAKDTVVGAMIRPFADDPMEPDLSDPDWEYVNYLLYHNATLGVISFSPNGTDWITIADKNYGATAPYGSSTGYSETYCGKFHQWGNNIGLAWLGTQISPSTVETSQVDASSYGPGNYYSADELYLISGSWDSSDNANLWGGQSQGYQTETYISADYSVATSTDKGVIKLGSDTVQTEPAQTPSSDTGRTFPVQLDASGRAVVNVPEGGGSGPKLIQVTVSTNSSTASKVGSTTAGTYSPTVGDLLLVNFVGGNSVSNVYLNIDNSGACPITVGGLIATADNFSLAQHSEVLLVYTEGREYSAYSTRNTEYSNLAEQSGGTSESLVTTGEKYVWNHLVDNSAYSSNRASDSTHAPTKSSVYSEIQNVKNDKQDKLTLPSTPTEGHLVVWGADKKTLVDGGSVPHGFNPTNTGDSGQILKRYGGAGDTTYRWEDENEANVKSWNINTSGTISSDTLKEITEWLILRSGSSITVLNGEAILKDLNTDDVFSYVKYSYVGSTVTLKFLGNKRITYKYTDSALGDYTTGRMREFDIIIDTSSSTPTYSWQLIWNPDDETHTNYLSCVGSGYTTPFIPTQDYQPTTKKYVDDTAGGKVNDTAYAASWDADTTHAPSKNAVYDKISSMDATIGGLVDDTAYGNSWDADTTHAPSKNAVYDKISDMDTTLTQAASDATKGVTVFTNDTGGYRIDVISSGNPSSSTNVITIFY